MKNGSPCIDILFLMSWLLACQSLMRQLDLNEGSFNVFRYYIHRYIRLAPLYAIVFLFVSYILPCIGTGPDWFYVKKMSESTRWSQLLYISDYYSVANDTSHFSPQMGMPESWYLASDMQMFWLSPLLIYPLWKWKKAGLIWVVFCLFTLISASAIPFVTIPDLLPTIHYFRL